MTRIGFLHTAHVHVATFDALVAAASAESGGGITAEHLVEPGLLDAVRRHGPSAQVRVDLAVALGRLAARCDVIVCTCSTLGPLAEAVEVPRPGVTVLRVDRPMAAAAARATAGAPIAVIVALASTLGPTRELLREEAARAGVEQVLVEIHVPQAWEAFEAGRTESYLEQIAAAARRAATEAAVIVLAQASMAPAVDRLGGLVGPSGEPVSVLTSPRLAVAAAIDLARRPDQSDRPDQPEPNAPT